MPALGSKNSADDSPAPPLAQVHEELRQAVSPDRIGELQLRHWESTETLCGGCAPRDHALCRNLSTPWTPCRLEGGTRAQGPRSHHEARPDWVRMVLERDHRLRQMDIAQQMGGSIGCVNRGAQHFDFDGSASLHHCPCHGRRRSITLPILEDEPSGTVLRQSDRGPRLGRQFRERFRSARTRSWAIW